MSIDYYERLKEVMSADGGFKNFKDFKEFLTSFQSLEREGTFKHSPDETAIKELSKLVSFKIEQIQDGSYKFIKDSEDLQYLYEYLKELLITNEIIPDNLSDVRLENQDWFIRKMQAIGYDVSSNGNAGIFK